MNIWLNFYLIIFIVIKNSKCSTVGNVRKGVLDYFAKHPNEAYKSDLDIIANKDWLIERFANGINDENKIRDKMISTLKYWKDINITDLSDQYFPSEFYATGHLMPHGQTKNNALILYFTGRCSPPWLLLDPKFTAIEMMRFVYYLRILTLKAAEKNFAGVVFMNNIRLDILHPKLWGHIISQIKLMDENSPSPVLGIDLNEKTQTFFNGLKRLVRKDFQERINFINRSELSKTVSPDQIPKFANGSNTGYNRMPSGVKSGQCLPQYKHISAKEWEDFKDKNIDCIIEGLAESGKSSVDEYLNTDCK